MIAATWLLLLDMHKRISRACDTIERMAARMDAERFREDDEC